MPPSPVQLIGPVRHQDDRGWFTESYNRDKFAAMGIDCTFVQDNHSLSIPAFTVRGLHFQGPPRAQAKLIRCIRGSIFDVAVDMRAGSPTFGHWVGAELSALNGQQLYIQAGFAHGFMTLEDECEVVYKCSDFYAPESDGGVRWNDPTIAISWPLPHDAKVHLSSKDHEQPFLEELESPFVYDGEPLISLEIES